MKTANMTQPLYVMNSSLERLEKPDYTQTFPPFYLEQLIGGGRKITQEGKGRTRVTHIIIKA
jgi:hypothetical protein